MVTDELKALADLLAKVLPYPLKRSGYVVLCRTKGSGAILVAETDESGVEMWDAIVASVNFLRDNLPAIIEQRAEIDRLREAMVLCREQFQFYANEHRAAGKMEKAATNQKYADIANAALNPTGQPA